MGSEMCIRDRFKLLVADVSSIENYSDIEKRDYFINFIIPEALKKVSSLFQVNTIGSIGPFGNGIDGCSNNGDFIIPQKYKDDPIDGDLLILISIKNIGHSGFIAYAGACSVGKFYDNYYFNK